MYSWKKKAEEIVENIDEIKSQEIVLIYPCKWEYKVVVEIEEDIKEIMNKAISKRDYKIKSSKLSKEGKYKSYTVSLLVHNNDDRKCIYESIKTQKNVKIVL